MGRPKGRKDTRRRRRTELRLLLEDSAPKLISKAVRLALAGDTTAMRLCLERLVPPLKAESVVDGPPAVAGGSLVELSRAVVEAALDGRMSANVARELTGALGNVARVQEVTELQERLAELERRYDEALSKDPTLGKSRGPTGTGRV